MFSPMLQLKLFQDCCSYLEDDVRVVDAVHADARDDVGEEEGQPADDEHPHHRPQSLGSLLLLRELGHLAKGKRFKMTKMIYQVFWH